MESLNGLINNLELGSNIELKDIPEIDLYMDQVIQLFEAKLESNKRNDDEKIMTKTMINNYVKGRLLMPVIKKKYSKNHIILLSLIYQLKGALSIADIKELLSKIVGEDNNKNEEECLVDLDDTYKAYLLLNKENEEDFKKEIATIESRINEKKIDEKEKENLLLATVLVNKANMYRRVAEKLIDTNNNIK
ncbi:MAG: DUF1836 domain-containing protein [Sarcina sp.]